METITIEALGAEYREGRTSPVAVADGVFERIDASNRKLNCFITLTKEAALRAAKDSADRFAAGSPRGPLDGVPIAVKDLFYIEGVRCTAGSKILSGNVATYDAPVIRRLKDAGAVVVGTTNLHEFAAGVTSANPHYGPVRNPWDPTRVAGGSSGGSAAAVSAGFASGALGTDTAGSVRIPAALCGVVGLKPTYGLVSRLGVVPLAPSLDTVGTLTLSSWDAAAMLDVIAGHDPGDMTTVDTGHGPVLPLIDKGVKGLRVGVPRAFFQELVDPSTEAAFDGFLSRLAEVGCDVKDFEVEVLGEAFDRWLPVRRAEATAFHMDWLRTTPELYGDDVRTLLELGFDVKAVDYVAALNSRPGMMERLTASMKGVDLLALPSTCVPAPAIGEKSVRVGSGTTEVYQALNRLTLPFNFLGFPAVSVPAGLVGGLPVGAQLVGRVFDEGACLSVCRALERAFGPWPSPSPSGA